MNILIPIVLCSLIGLALFETYFTSVFVSSFRQDKENIYEDDELPKVAIALCLRGADPFLAKCLQALLKQNYPAYELRIVVDSPEDPAWNIATQTLQARADIPVHLSTLRIQHPTCSLKCKYLGKFICIFFDKVLNNYLGVQKTAIAE